MRKFLKSHNKWVSGQSSKCPLIWVAQQTQLMVEGMGYLALASDLSIFEMGVSMARTPEGKFQDSLVKSLEEIFPGCMVQKNDPNYRQGVPDLLILFRGRWALLEVKKSEKADLRPNQQWYVDWAQANSFGSFIFPENRDEVLKALFAFFMNRHKERN